MFNVYLKVSFIIYNIYIIIIVNKCFKNCVVIEFCIMDWNLLYFYENEKKILLIFFWSKVFLISIWCLFYWVYMWKKIFI